MFVSVGFGSIISLNHVIAFGSPDSAPIKRVVQEAEQKGMLIDLTYGRRRRSVLFADSGHVIISAVQSETIGERVKAIKAGRPVPNEKKPKLSDYD